MLAPIVRAAAEQYPDTSFTMLSQQRFADLFAGMPANVTFLGVDIKKQSLFDIVSGLGSYDMVADMHSVIRSVYIRAAMLFKGAKTASIHKGRAEKRQLINGMIHRPLRHTTERYAEVFASLGLPITLPSNHCIGEGNGIGIAPFAAHQGKI
jgi:ADP-heptose:LPS heptosyltransferase